MVVLKITLFLFSSNLKSPCKSESSLTLSDIDSKLSQMDFTLLNSSSCIDNIFKNQPNLIDHGYRGSLNPSLEILLPNYLFQT